MPKSIIAELAAKLDCNVGEGPFWDDTKEELYFVDITNKEIKIFNPDSKSIKTIQFNQEISAVFLDHQSELIVAARDGVFAATQDGVLKALLAPIELEDTSIRTNDAKCDATGRMWVGTMAFDFRPGAAALFSFDSDNLKEMVSTLTISNGTGWSVDHKLMYFIDSPTKRVDIFDFDLERGELRNRRPFLSLEDLDAFPDGLTTDEDGGVWVALFGGGEVRRFDSDGVLTHVVSIPVKQVTSCCFGGGDMSELFITTAQYGMDSDSLTREPLAGSLFRVKTTFKGSKSNRYGVKVA
jgi:sugar lactone lactonase YvrE